MALITINGVSLDPVTQMHALAAAGLTSQDAQQSRYLLIQTTAPLEPDQRTQLAGLGVDVQEYVSSNTYLCSHKAADLATIRALPFVVWADVYLREFKVAASLQSPGARTLSLATTVPPKSHATTPHTVDIVFHDGVTTSDTSLKDSVATAARVDKDTLPAGKQKVRLTVEERFLDDLAALDGVRTIAEVPEVSLRNNVARPIIHADVVVAGTTYQGDGQVVAVADTGFDTGSPDAPHPAFTGRVDRLYAVGRVGRANDPHGHGTHVCGSVLGDGSSSSMGGSIQGTAPRAHLVVQSLLSGFGGLATPPDLTDLFLPPYDNDGARVHTNSWGATTPALPYTQSAGEIDAFVWNHPDMVICFASGNDGRDGNGDGIVDPAQVGAEAAAKNCITVGASESLRREVNARFPTYGSLRPTSFPKPPLHDDPMADQPDGMAAFSNRGPTQEGRLKPDVVAPGTSILSARSRDAGLAANDFGTSTDADYFFDSGTSMATPLVAGCAAVLRETLVRNGRPSPSAALIKALLINGAVALPGQYSPSETGSTPNTSEGFGRVDLAGSVIIPGGDPNAGLDEGGPLKQGEEHSFTVDIPEQPSGTAVPTGLGVTFKITLVWTDPPGAELQNDLDLIVIAADGSERHGNMGISKGFDRTNNVEQVMWLTMPPGKAQVTIRAHRITRFPQPFAYAWRIG